MRVMICAALLLGLTGSAAFAADEKGTYTYVKGTPVPYQAFAYGDFTNPATGLPYQSTDPGAAAMLQKMNDAERTLNAMGHSLREGEVKIVQRAIANPNVLLQEIGAGLGISPETLKATMKKAIDDCPLVTVEDLGPDIKTIPLPGLKPMLAKHFVGKINQQQELLCRLGYSMVDKAHAGASQFVSELLAKRHDLIETLGVSEYHPVFNFSILSTLAEVAGVAALKNELEHPSPARLYDLARKVTAPLPPELQLPDIPSIPAPTLPKRPNLALKKRKTWDGLDLGSHDLVAGYANAWLEINGTETAEEISAEGKAGMWILANEINVVYAGGRLYAGQDGVDGDLKAAVLGIDLYSKHIEKAVSYTWGDDRAFYYPLVTEYKQQFMAGPIPIVVTVGAKGEAGLGWFAGLTLLSANAGVKPFLAASAYGKAAVGIQDFLEAGAGGEILVLRDDVRLSGDAAIKFDQEGVPYLAMNLVGINEYRALDGRLFVYAQLDPLGPFADAIGGVVDAVVGIGQAVGDVISDIGSAIGDVFGFSGGNPLKIYKEWDIYSFNGFQGNDRFLNYGIKITPFGVTMTGDSIDNTDREEAAHLNDVMSLHQLEVAIAQLEHDVLQKEADLFTAMAKDLDSDAAKGVVIAQQDLAAALPATDAKRDAYLAHLEDWTGEPL